MWVARIPQEDFCQALGIAPDRKYENDGGPSVRDCLAVLANSEHADEDRSTFALTQLAFWLLAATDGHAKNFSIQHRRAGRFHLAPLYDVLSARISWPTNGPSSPWLCGGRARTTGWARSRRRTGVDLLRRAGRVSGIE